MAAFGSRKNYKMPHETVGYKVPDKTVGFTCKIALEQLPFASGFIAPHNAWFFRVHSG